MVARHLVEGNLAGLESHGVMRLRQYHDAVQTGQIDPTVLPDGRIGNRRHGRGRRPRGLGRAGRLPGRGAGRAQGEGRRRRRRQRQERRPHPGAPARTSCASPRTAWWHSSSAALVHAAFVVPWGGREARFGTNPIAIAMPGSDHPVVMDLATSATAEGKVQVYRNAGRNMPEGLIIDANGHPSTDPNDVYRGGGILPFGGANGHKGYCLAVMADLLGGALSGSHVGVRAGSFRNHFLLTAIDPDALGGAEAMRAIVDEYSQWLKSSETQPGFAEVLNARRTRVAQRRGAPARRGSRSTRPPSSSSTCSPTSSAYPASAE